MPQSTPIELSPYFSYDALASFVVLDARHSRTEIPCGEGTVVPSTDAANAADVARARLLEFLATGVHTTSGSQSR